MRPAEPAEVTRRRAEAARDAAMSAAAPTVRGVAEPVERWWSRRQFSRGAEVPFPVGSYREAWASYPVLVRQYHPDLNAGIVLSQIPPAAEVLLQWQCDAGHIFVATPAEQRSRPGGRRRRSAWCPDCAELARPRRVLPARIPAASAPTFPASTAAAMEPAAPARRRSVSRTPSPTPTAPGVTHPPGTAFASVHAPTATSAAEGRLRAAIASRLEVDLGFTAVAVARPFFGRREVWPDVVLDELRVALEYDSTGRHGLEHVGRREQSDRRKDQLLREVGWEVVRVRTGRLLALGPHDVIASGVSSATVDRVVDQLEAIRGPLLVSAYRRRGSP